MNKSKLISVIGEIMRTIFIVLIIVVPFRAFVAQPFLVVGNSMLQTFHNKEYLIVDQISPYFKEIKRGDVVIVKFPNLNNKYLIKRVVGLPGETLSLENGKVFISKRETSGQIKRYELIEPYVYFNEDRKFQNQNTQVVTLEEDEYYVLGDNRLESADSRIFGPIKKTNIKGEPLIRLLPVNKISYKPGFISPIIKEVIQ